MTLHIEAPFTLDTWDAVADASAPAGGPATGRVIVAKTYTGPVLVATATGHALTAQGPGGASYVAQERIAGSLDGRGGTFVLEHRASMGEGHPTTMAATVVPGSGTGALTGIAGRGQVAHELLTLDVDLPTGGPAATDPDLAARARTLLDLHTAPEILTLANVWDVVSAQVVAATTGVRALATASHAIAAAFGYSDGEQIPLDLHLDMVARITRAVDLPVTMDFEGGYGDAGETARRAIAAGAVGGNLEDQLKPLDEAVAAVEAVLRAGRDAGIDFVLNARTDTFVLASEGADRRHLLAEAARRGLAFLAVGAPVIFVPGVTAREEIKALVDQLGPHRLSVISVPGVSLPASELQDLGVARVSSGPYTQRVALTALQDATAALVAGGVLPGGTRALN